jgi:hypothetical protein
MALALRLPLDAAEGWFAAALVAFSIIGYVALTGRRDTPNHSARLPRELVPARFVMFNTRQRFRKLFWLSYMGEITAPSSAVFGD